MRCSLCPEHAAVWLFYTQGAVKVKAPACGRHATRLTASGRWSLDTTEGAYEVRPLVFTPPRVWVAFCILLVLSCLVGYLTR